MTFTVYIWRQTLIKFLTKKKKKKNPHYSHTVLWVTQGGHFEYYGLGQCPGAAATNTIRGISLLSCIPSTRHHGAPGWKPCLLMSYIPRPSQRTWFTVRVNYQRRGEHVRNGTSLILACTQSTKRQRLHRKIQDHRSYIGRRWKVPWSPVRKGWAQQQQGTTQHSAVSEHYPVAP